MCLMFSSLEHGFKLTPSYISYSRFGFGSIFGYSSWIIYFDSKINCALTFISKNSSNETLKS